MGAFLSWNNRKNSLAFDVITSEVQVKSSMITEHPVEEGANITDHVRPNLDRVTLEGFISNTPVYDVSGTSTQTPTVLDIKPLPLNISVNGAIDAIGGALHTLLKGPADITASLMIQDNPQDYVAGVISTLSDLRENAVLIEVRCPSWSYESMLIESFEVHRDPDSGTGATFQIELREIRTVKSSVTAAPIPSVPRAAVNKPKGAQSPNTPSAPNQSVALSAVKAL